MRMPNKISAFRAKGTTITGWVETQNKSGETFAESDLHEAAVYVRDDIHAALEAECAELRNALSMALAWFTDPDGDLLEQWERIAEEFYRDTGYLRPGKSYPLGAYVPEDLESIWAEWTFNRSRAVFKKMEAAYLTKRQSADAQKEKPE